MHTDARLSIPSHLYTHAHTSTRTRVHEGMAADERGWSRRCVCACASRHPDMPRGPSVDTNAHCTDGHTTPARSHKRTHAHAPMESTCTLTHIHVLIQIYVDVCARAAFDARARTYAHAHTLAWNLHVHPYAHTCAHTFT